MGGNSLPRWCVGVRQQKEVLRHEIADVTTNESLFPTLIERYKAQHVVEVGVAQGTLSKRMVMQFKGSLLDYICVDPWIPYPEWSDRPWKDWELSASWWERVYQKVKAWADKNPEVTVYRMTSMEASRKVSDCSVNGVYIDSIHDFPNLVCDVWAWLPKIIPGGFISGHDYVRRFSGLIEAVDMIFGSDLRLVHKLGGSWFVAIDSEDTKQKYLNVIRERVGESPEILLKNPPDLFRQKDKVTA